MSGEPGAGSPAAQCAMLLVVAWIRLIRYGVQWHVITPARAMSLTAWFR